MTPVEKKEVRQVLASLSSKRARQIFMAKLVTAADYQEYADRKKKEGEKPLGKEEWEKKTQGGAGGEKEEKKPEKKEPEKKEPAKKEKSGMPQTEEEWQAYEAEAATAAKAKAKRNPKDIPDYEKAWEAEAKGRRDESDARERGKKIDEDSERERERKGKEWEAENKKKASLRQKLIRLAYAKPQFRAQILSLLE
jgi:hypothetical protein